MSTKMPPMMKARAKATAPMLMGIAVATMNMTTRPMIVRLEIIAMSKRWHGE